ncbi:MAG: hypothetical protein JRH20_11290 [Deltaproteobacteria bacterium]|nr:hypothetical protein [Deltaproteobacteria bacterium]
MLVVYILVGVLAQVLVTVLLYRWARAVAQRRGGVWWQRASWLPLLALGLSIAGTLVSAVHLVRAFQAIATADPSMKATLLASNISEALTYTALLVLPSWLLYIASIVVSAMGSMMRRPS